MDPCPCLAPLLVFSKQINKTKLLISNQHPKLAGRYRIVSLDDQLKLPACFMA